MTLEFFRIIGFHDSPAGNERTENPPLAIAYTAHLCNQFNHEFAVLIFMPRFKSINFYQNTSKITLFLQKKLQNLQMPGLPSGK